MFWPWFLVFTGVNILFLAPELSRTVSKCGVDTGGAGVSSTPGSHDRVRRDAGLKSIGDWTLDIPTKQDFNPEQMVDRLDGGEKQDKEGRGKKQDEVGNKERGNEKERGKEGEVKEKDDEEKHGKEGAVQEKDDEEKHGRKGEIREKEKELEGGLSEGGSTMFSAILMKTASQLAVFTTGSIHAASISLSWKQAKGWLLTVVITRAVDLLIQSVSMSICREVPSGLALFSLVIFTFYSFWLCHESSKEGAGEKAGPVAESDSEATSGDSGITSSTFVD